GRRSSASVASILSTEGSGRTGRENREGGHQVAVHQIARYVRPYEEARENMLERARRGTFEFTEYDVVASVFDRLTSLDKDAWAAAFMDVARPYEERAQEAEARGATAA